MNVLFAVKQNMASQELQQATEQLDEAKIAAMFDDHNLQPAAMDPNVPPTYNPDSQEKGAALSQLEFLYRSLALQKLHEKRQKDAKAHKLLRDIIEETLRPKRQSRPTSSPSKTTGLPQNRRMTVYGMIPPIEK